MFLCFFFFFPPKNFPLSFHNLLLCQIFLLFLFQNAIQSSLPYQIVSERKFILQQCVSMIHAQNIRLLISTTSQSLAILSFIFICSQFPSFASSFFHDPPPRSFPHLVNPYLESLLIAAISVSKRRVILSQFYPYTWPGRTCCCPWFV